MEPWTFSFTNMTLRKNAGIPRLCFNMQDLLITHTHPRTKLIYSPSLLPNQKKQPRPNEEGLPLPCDEMVTGDIERQLRKLASARLPQEHSTSLNNLHQQKQQHLPRVPLPTPQCKFRICSMPYPKLPAQFSSYTNCI